MVRYLFYTIGDLTYQSPLVEINVRYVKLNPYVRNSNATVFLKAEQSCRPEAELC